MLGSNACWPASIACAARSRHCHCGMGNPPGSIAFTRNNPKSVETRLTSNEDEYDCILESWLKWEVYSMLPWKNYCMIAPNMHSNMQMISTKNLNQWFISKALPLKSTGTNISLLESQPPWCLLKTWVSDPDLFTRDTHFSEICQALGVAQGEWQICEAAQ